MSTIQIWSHCAWQRSLPRETNTGATKEIPALNQSWRGRNHLTSNWPYQGHQVLSRGPSTACHHCGQTPSIDHMLLECAVLQECHDEYCTANSLKFSLRQFPRLAWWKPYEKQDSSIWYEWSDILCNSSLESPPTWSNLLTSTSPQTWTIELG